MRTKGVRAASPETFYRLKAKLLPQLYLRLDRVIERPPIGTRGKGLPRSSFGCRRGREPRRWRPAPTQWKGAGGGGCWSNPRLVAARLSTTPPATRGTVTNACSLSMRPRRADLRSLMLLSVQRLASGYADRGPASLDERGDRAKADSPSGGAGSRFAHAQARGGGGRSYGAPFSSPTSSRRASPGQS